MGIGFMIRLRLSYRMYILLLLPFELLVKCKMRPKSILGLVLAGLWGGLVDLGLT